MAKKLKQQEREAAQKSEKFESCPALQHRSGNYFTQREVETPEGRKAMIRHLRKTGVVIVGR